MRGGSGRPLNVAPPSVTEQKHIFAVAVCLPPERGSGRRRSGRRTCPDAGGDPGVHLRGESSQRVALALFRASWCFHPVFLLPGSSRGHDSCIAGLQAQLGSMSHPRVDSLLVTRHGCPHAVPLRCVDIGADRPGQLSAAPGCGSGCPRDRGRRSRERRTAGRPALGPPRRRRPAAARRCRRGRRWPGGSSRTCLWPSSR